MSGTSFSSPDQIEPPTEDVIRTTTPLDQLSQVYELTKVVDWVEENGLSRVALQFPDYLLGDAPRVAKILTDLMERETFILGDTTFGSCCVDEVAASHMNADSVVHFGHTCLTPARSLPVLYIFTRRRCDTEVLGREMQTRFGDTGQGVVLVYDVEYHHILSDWSWGESLVGRCVEGGEEEEGVVVVAGRRLAVESLAQLEGKKVVFVGAERGEQTLVNLMLGLPSSCEFFVYSGESLVPAGLTVSKLVMRRYFLVEKTRDAERVGLLVGTLGTRDFDTILDRLRRVVRLAGKKVYTFLVGKPNVAKLANFPEIDVFVLVACPETTLLDSKEFLRPVVTPWELEMALSPGLEWTGEVVTDFRELLPGGARYRGEPAPPPEGDGEGDVSLITGRVRGVGLDRGSSRGELQVINDKTVSVLHEGGGGQFLAGRTWNGLEQDLGQTPVQGPAEVVQGRPGVAAGYEGEPDTS